MIHLTLHGNPITKKNSQRILYKFLGRGKKTPFVAPSKAFEDYQESCLWQLRTPHSPISACVNVRCIYYMKTRRKVDLGNLLAATCDILVKAKVLEDDNCKIVAGHDGSRVEYDKIFPRVEIEITEMEDENETIVQM